MSEPKRWLDEGAPRDIEHLLHAAQAEQPDETSLAKTLAALGIGLGMISIGASAQAAAATVSAGGAAHATVSITGGLLVKWAALGATLGTLAAGAATIARDAPRVTQTPAPSVGSPERAEPNDVPAVTDRFIPDRSKPEPIEQGSSSSADVSRAAPTVARGAAATALPSAVPLEAETLAEEVRIMDRARAMLAAGRAAETLAVLDEYQRRFPERRFAPEALYLRMEAFVSLGRTAEARAAAESLLARYPNSPHGARARVVLSDNR
jgi:TolA-binding protein